MGNIRKKYHSVRTNKLIFFYKMYVIGPFANLNSTERVAIVDVWNAFFSMLSERQTS